MPLTWMIDYDKRLVRAIAQGKLTTQDLRDYFAAVTAEGAASYGKLFDALQASSFLKAEDIEAAGAMIRELTRTTPGPIGPVAVITDSPEFHVQVEFFADSAQRDRPLRIFRDEASARAWLDDKEP